MHVFSCHHCPAAASEDSLFDAIDRLQGDRPWGRTLDAGTGAGSLAWLLSKPPHAFAAPLVAVTASPVMRSDLVRQFPMADAADAPAPPVAATDVAPPAAPLDASAWALGAGVRLVMGEWASGALLPNETFDTVVADYLVGAVDGFAPHLQDIVGAAFIYVGGPPSAGTQLGASHRARSRACARAGLGKRGAPRAPRRRPAVRHRHGAVPGPRTLAGRAARRRGARAHARAPGCGRYPP